MSRHHELDEILAELYARQPEQHIRPRLEPTARLVGLMGDPQKNYGIIHITGTNGKTSTTRMIERILREHNLRTGRFTSPHLVHINERIALDGVPVEDERLASVWDDIQPALEIADRELLAAGEAKLTFFEALAVLAFAVFADAMIDVLVLEVGMGGEWDSTNVADGDVAVFTPIDLDHTERLGATIADIAETKAGIIKPGAIVVSSAQTPAAREVLERRSSIATRLVWLGEDFSVESQGKNRGVQTFAVSGLAGNYSSLGLRLFGEFQISNAAVAVAAVEAFLGGGEHPINHDLLQIALLEADSPGRMQLVAGEPDILLDAAHNPSGVQTLVSSLESDFADRFRVAVISILADKDAKGMFERMADCFDYIVVTQSSSPRAISVAELEKIASAVLDPKKIKAAPSLVEAISLAGSLIAKASDVIQAPDGKSDAGVRDGLVVVSGSISLVGDFLASQLPSEETHGD